MKPPGVFEQMVLLMEHKMVDQCHTELVDLATSGYSKHGRGLLVVKMMHEPFSVEFRPRLENMPKRALQAVDKYDPAKQMVIAFVYGRRAHCHTLLKARIPMDGVNLN